IGWELQTVEMVSIAFDFLRDAGFNPHWLSDEEIRQLAQGPTFRFREPHSKLTFEYYAQIETMAAPFAPTVTQIERLGHVVLSVKNFDEMLTSLVGKLNFRISDQSPGNVAFLR